MSDSSDSGLISRSIRAPRGPALSCRGWQQESVLRLLINSVDAEVAEQPEELIVCAGGLKAASDWNSFRSIIDLLRKLADDETLLIRSGHPEGIFPTHVDAPRVVVANSGGYSVPRATADPINARVPDLAYLTLPATWLYVGSQAALPFFYEAFASIARAHFGGTLAGRLVIAGGMGGLGGAQALAATLNGAAFLGIEVDAERIKRRVKTGYCDVMVNDLDEALRMLKNAVRKRQTTSVGLIGNCADLIPALAQRGVVPDVLTDLTSVYSAEDATSLAYVPRGLTAKQAASLRHEDVTRYNERALESIVAHANGIAELQRLGTLAFDCGNGLRPAAYERGVRHAHNTPSITEHAPSALSADRDLLTCVALSGEPADIGRLDRLLLDVFPEDVTLHSWIAIARKHVRPQGLPARVCWIAHDRRAQLLELANQVVADGELKAPIVMGFAGVPHGLKNLHPSAFQKLLVHLANDANMFRGSETATDSRIVDDLLQTAAGASLVSTDARARAAYETRRVAQVFVIDGSGRLMANS
jgi:urocanate hydratase